MSGQDMIQALKKLECHWKRSSRLWAYSGRGSL